MNKFQLIVINRIEIEKQRLEAEREKIRQEEADRISRENARADLQAKAQAANDQRGKPPVSESESATNQAQDQVAERQSTPPIQADDEMIDDFIRLLPIGIVEKKAMRANIVKWERYRVAREMQAAA